MGHNSRQYPIRTRGASILPARIDSCVLTLTVFSLSVPKQQEVHPHSSERTDDSRVSKLKDVVQLPGAKTGITSAPYAAKSYHRCSRTLLRSIEAYDPTQR